MCIRQINGLFLKISAKTPSFDVEPNFIECRLLTSDFEAFKDCTVSFSEKAWMLKKQMKYNDCILSSLFCLTFFPIAINWGNFVRGGGFEKRNLLRKSLGTWSRLYWRRKTTFLYITVLVNCSLRFLISSLRR